MPTSTFSGLLHDVASPARRGGISYEVSSLSFFTELLDELNGMGQEQEAEDDVITLQGHNNSTLSRIDSRLINKHIRRGQLERRDVIVDTEAIGERQSSRSRPTQRVFSFSSGRTGSFTSATPGDTPSRADPSSTDAISRAAHGALAKRKCG